jgi:hypothetical protein
MHDVPTRHLLLPRKMHKPNGCKHLGIWNTRSVVTRHVVSACFQAQVRAAGYLRKSASRTRLTPGPRARKSDAHGHQDQDNGADLR